MQPIGRTRWAIAEGYIPGWSHGSEPEMTSQETACILNAGDTAAHVTITVFFADREPAAHAPRVRYGGALAACFTAAASM